MDSSFSASSRRSYDLPTPETGLAEWTSKIKALQREVDADEEAEQKRLEEEISAARQARLRRSRGPGAGGRADSLDSMSNSKDQRSDSPNDTSANDTPKSTAERIKDQETALRKLMDRNDVYNPDKILSSIRTDKPDTPSLAAFIGGRGTGPRLNRHAPQVDAHDPTQFMQPDVSAPHPIFGKGGVAMPGMAAKKDPKISSTIGSEISERYRPSSTVTTLLKSPSPPVVNQDADRLFEPIKQDNVDLRRRSFTTTKELTPTPTYTNKSAEKSESNLDRKPFASNETIQRNQKSFDSATKPLSFVSAAKKESTFSSDPPSKPSDNYRSAVTSASKPSPTPTYSGTTSYTPTSYLPKKVAEPSTPLRRLMESNKVHNPDKIEADAPRKTIAERAQGVSLAGFIGGNGTGPRLNRHAPQVDAHDPTQFIQPDTSAPHPIFGRGGVAMPGLATRKSTDPNPSTDSAEHYRPSSTSRPTWPPVATNYISKTQERPVSPQKTGNRDRTTSAPGLRPDLGSSASKSPGGWTPPTTGYTNVRNPSPTKELRPATPVRDRTLSGPSYTQNTITTPSLARPIQPKPQSSPQIIGSIVPSPAFQKPAPSKDLTPSISRLQGRGFVQNMVKVSSQLEIPASPTPPQGSAQSRPSSAAGRKGSVLDRWQPNAQATSPTKSPSFPDPMRRSTTQEPSGHSYSPRTPISGSFTGSSTHSLKSVASLPSIAKSASVPPKTPAPEPAREVDLYPRSRTPGLGSATTMVLIKPSKSSSDLTQIPHVDELGVKHGSQGDRTDRTQFHDTPPTSKKPLIHPTKDRAKKPKKHGDTRDRVDYLEELMEPAQTIASFEPSAQPLQIPTPPETLTFASLDISHRNGQKSPSSPIWSSLQKAGNIAVVKVGSESLGLATAPAITSADNISPPESSPIVEQKSPIESSGSKTAIEYNSSQSVSVSPSVPLSPGKHVRIPSTGNRSTVMEIAQILSEHSQSSTLTSDPASPVDDSVLARDLVAKSRVNFSQSQAEKRKSSYEKYSAIILPPLKEEATPTPTPAGTLGRGNDRSLNSSINLDDIKFKQDVSQDTEEHKEEEGPPQGQRVPHVLETEPTHISQSPSVDVKKLLNQKPRAPKVQEDLQTISVEVLAITGTTATPITGPSDIFYDTEILTIVHRVKSRSTGLVSTSVWCWLGSRSILGDREDRKLNDLAKRYGTSAKLVHQLAETTELIQTLGGSLAIRQGTRTHWSAENTTMHLVRSLNGAVLIDEHDLNIKDLCSGYSYCITILGSIYVWHGCGSTSEERNAALIYSKRLSNDTTPPTELLEGQSDNDEMFWMILGNEDYATADYWRWRKSSSVVEPSIWRIAIADGNELVVPVEFISMEQTLHVSVYIINCIWELFVLVGKDARSDKQTIRLALDTAMAISKEVTPSRPYAPTVHTLILPSQIPSDLRLSVRDLDEAWLNDGQIPDHMNLLSCSEAEKHLSKQSWETSALKDPDMLPLGVGLTEIC